MKHFYGESYLYLLTTLKIVAAAEVHKIYAARLKICLPCPAPPMPIICPKISWVSKANDITTRIFWSNILIFGIDNNNRGPIAIVKWESLDEK